MKMHQDSPKETLAYLAKQLDDEPDLMNQLGQVRLIELLLNKARAQIVSEARAGGTSWQEIGDALGISKQAAWERYGQDQPA